MSTFVFFSEIFMKIFHFGENLTFPLKKCETFTKISDFQKSQFEIETFLKNRDPPMGFQMSEFEFQSFLFVFLSPPNLGHCHQIFPFFNYDASP